MKDGRDNFFLQYTALRFIRSQGEIVNWPEKYIGPKTSQGPLRLAAAPVTVVYCLRYAASYVYTLASSTRKTME